MTNDSSCVLGRRAEMQHISTTTISNVYSEDSEGTALFDSPPNRPTFYVQVFPPKNGLFPDANWMNDIHFM